MKEVLNKSVVILLSFFAVALSIFGSMTVMAGPTGTVDLEIDELTEVSFTVDAIDWGAGTVNGTDSNTAVLQSNGTGSVTGGSWAVNSDNLTLENIGTEDVSLVLNSSTTATTFIGGTGASFKWMVSNVTGEDSCVAANATGFEEVNTTAGSTVCSTFYADNSKDSIDINFELTIPLDADDTAGTTTATITAIATEI